MLACSQCGPLFQPVSVDSDIAKFHTEWLTVGKGWAGQDRSVVCGQKHGRDRIVGLGDNPEAVFAFMASVSHEWEVLSCMGERSYCRGGVPGPSLALA